MRRADRLVELLGHFRRSSLLTADDLAERLQVSVRTVYRDILSLQAQGFPIEGQAGVGYVLRGRVELPPLTFDHDQLEALALGLAYVVQVGDPSLRAAAVAARGKVDAAWTRQPAVGVAARAIRAAQRPERRAPAFAAALRAALRARRLVTFGYVDARGAASDRRVRPLALTAFSEGWLLIAWCTERQDFRVFRLDRMRDPAVDPETFADEPGRDLASYLGRVRLALEMP